MTEARLDKREEWSTAVDRMNDAEFDALLPTFARLRSRTYWTPVAVARCAAQVLAELGIRRVLDLGCGPGKLCIVAGARAPHIAFAGIDHRPRLVATSRAIATEVGVSNASFEVGDATRANWSGFDALYVFNSFAENSFAPADQFDETVELTPARRIADVLRIESALAAMPVGTVLVTYHGLGGPIPGSYERIHLERVGSGFLQVWRRAHADHRDHYWIEDGAEAEIADAAQVGRYLSCELGDG